MKSGNKTRMVRFSFILGIFSLAALLVTAGCSDRIGNQEGGVDNLAQQNLYSQFERQARALVTDTASPALSTRSSDRDRARFIDPHEPLQFWVYLALLRDAQGQHYAVQQRFARLRVSTDTAQKLPVTGDSQWDYTHILAIDAQFDHLTGDVQEVHRLAQREALALAGADEANQRIWVGAFEAKNDSTSACQINMTLNSPQVNLHFEGMDSTSAACVQNGQSRMVQTVGFAVHRSAALQVTGGFVRNTQTVSLEGYGWMIRGRGVPPDSAAAAVVFDRAWLLMDNDINMQLQRSRRASGRGPRFVSGSVFNKNHTSGAAVTPLGRDTELVDAEQKTTHNVPVSWQLNSPENAMSLKLTPVSTQQALMSVSGQSWFGVVSIDGSHQGYGFLDYSLR